MTNFPQWLEERRAILQIQESPLLAIRDEFVRFAGDENESSVLHQRVADSLADILLLLRDFLSGAAETEDDRFALLETGRMLARNSMDLCVWMIGDHEKAAPARQSALYLQGMEINSLAREQIVTCTQLSSLLLGAVIAEDTMPASMGNA